MWTLGTGGGHEAHLSACYQLGIVCYWICHVRKRDDLDGVGRRLGSPLVASLVVWRPSAGFAATLGLITKRMTIPAEWVGWGWVGRRRTITGWTTRWSRRMIEFSNHPLKPGDVSLQVLNLASQIGNGCVWRQIGCGTSSGRVWGPEGRDFEAWHRDCSPRPCAPSTVFSRLTASSIDITLSRGHHCRELTS